MKTCPGLADYRLDVVVVVFRGSVLSLLCVLTSDAGRKETSTSGPFPRLYLSVVDSASRLVSEDVDVSDLVGQSYYDTVEVVTSEFHRQLVLRSKLGCREPPERGCWVYCRIDVEINIVAGQHKCYNNINLFYVVRRYNNSKGKTS